MMPGDGQSPVHSKTESDGLQANGNANATVTATAAILNLSTRYRDKMEVLSGQPLAPATKVIKLGHLEKVFNVVNTGATLICV